MAPQYKLTYFDRKAKGEPIRYLFSYGDIEFQDIRVGSEEWPKLKADILYGKLPILEINGYTHHQSVSICRYLSKIVGLTGVNDCQNLKIDSTVDTIEDLRLEILKIKYAEESARAKVRENLQKEIFPFYLGRMDAQVEDNGGYLVDNKLTWADLHLAATVEAGMELLGNNPIDNYPNLKALVDKVWNLPQIKAWRANRPTNVMLPY